MPAAPVSDWGDALITSFSAALTMFLSAIPRVIAFAVILIIGWFIASLIAKAVASLLRMVNFNDLAQKSGFSGFVQNMGANTDSVGLIASITKWFVRLIVLVVAFDALGLPAVSEVLQQLLLWLPNLVVALVILVLAGLAANAVSSLVRGASSEAGFSNPALLATAARVAIWTFAVVIAVNQLGIATTLVNTLFMGFIAALSIALGLAFGLGGRDTAGRIVAGWYESSSGMAGRLERAANSAERQARHDSGQPMAGQGVTFDRRTDSQGTAVREATTPLHTTAADTRDDDPAIRDAVQSPPDPNYGRPLRTTQND